MLADEEVKDEVEEEVELEEEEKKEVETPEEKMQRLETQNAEFIEKEKSMMNEHSQLGRRNKELLDRQDKADARLAELAANMNKPKQEDAGFRDLNDPAEANKWFDEKVNERMAKDDREQKEYSTQYDKDVDKLLDERGVDAEEREFIMSGLEKQKKNMFDDTRLSAEVNIDKVSNTYWKEKATGATNKTLNLKRDTAKGAGVGGTGTAEPTKKKTVDTPAMTSLKSAFATEKQMRSW